MKLLQVFRRELHENGCFRRFILAAVYSIVQWGERPGTESSYVAAAVFQE